jgi:hypothetical protein
MVNTIHITFAKGFLIIFSTLFLWTSVVLGQNISPDINLVCLGSGSVAATQTSLTNQYDPKTKSYSYGTANTSVRRQFSGSTEVKISGPNARIKLPSDMIPAMSDDDGGWFIINDLMANEREIVGTLRINMFNKPDLRIVRITGQITLKSGLGDFSGKCESIEAGAKPKF